MTVARTMLASGVTSTRNASSTADAATTRRTRGTPSTPPSSIVSATSTAQFEPDTAVRCDRDDVRIASLRSSGTAEVSPMVSPGRRAAPSPESPAATWRKEARIASARPASPDAVSPGRRSPRAATTNGVSPPGSTGSTVARRPTRCPTSTAPDVVGPSTRTDTRPCHTPSPLVTERTSIAATRDASVTRSDAVPSSSTVCPTSATRSGGYRVS
jgi:hypothetical protein